MADFDLDLEKLKAEQEAAEGKKDLLTLAGGVGDILANRQGFGNYFTGHMGPKKNVSGFTSALAEGIQSPIERERKAMEYLKAKRGMALDREQDALNAAKKDPNSKQSMALKAVAERWGIKPTSEMSAYDIEQMIDPKKMMETEAQSAVNFENQKKLREMDHGFDMKKLAAQLTMDQAKKDQPQRLPPDKVLAVNEGNAIPTMLKDISQSIENNTSAFGPIVGRLRGANPYDDTAQALQSQVKAASQAFGRLMEGGVLRKEDEEKYQKMFPQPSDTPSTARNKLEIVNKLLVDKQKSNLQALKNSGYDISGLDGATFAEGQLPAVLSGTPAPAAPNASPLKLAIQEEKARRARLKNTAGK